MSDVEAEKTLECIPEQASKLEKDWDSWLSAYQTTLEKLPGNVVPFPLFEIQYPVLWFRKGEKS